MAHHLVLSETIWKRGRTPLILIQTYYTPFLHKIQVSLAKIRFFVDSDNFYVNIIMLTPFIIEQKFLHISTIAAFSWIKRP